MSRAFVFMFDGRSSEGLAERKEQKYGPTSVCLGFGLFVFKWEILTQDHPVFSCTLLPGTLTAYTLGFYIEKLLACVWFMHNCQEFTQLSSHKFESAANICIQPSAPESN